MGYFCRISVPTYAWEQRGRGWKVFGEPVHLESEFIPFLAIYPLKEKNKLILEGGYFGSVIARVA
jgi:hypothetical protein